MSKKWEKPISSHTEFSAQYFRLFEFYALCIAPSISLSFKQSVCTNSFTFVSLSVNSFVLISRVFIMWNRLSVTYSNCKKAAVAQTDGSLVYFESISSFLHFWNITEFGEVDRTELISHVLLQYGKWNIDGAVISENRCPGTLKGVVKRLSHIGTQRALRGKFVRASKWADRLSVFFPNFLSQLFTVFKRCSVYSFIRRNGYLIVFAFEDALSQLSNANWTAIWVPFNALFSFFQSRKQHQADRGRSGCPNGEAVLPCQHASPFLLFSAVVPFQISFLTKPSFGYYPYDPRSVHRYHCFLAKVLYPILLLDHTLL